MLFRSVFVFFFFSYDCRRCVDRLIDYYRIDTVTARRVCTRETGETPGVFGAQTDEEVCETLDTRAERSGARELHGGVEGASRPREEH